MWVYVTRMWVAWGCQRRLSCFLELKLQAVISCQTQVLSTHLCCSARTGGTLQPRALSPAPESSPHTGLSYNFLPLTHSNSTQNHKMGSPRKPFVTLFILSFPQLPFRSQLRWHLPGEVFPLSLPHPPLSLTQSSTLSTSQFGFLPPLTRALELQKR